MEGETSVGASSKSAKEDKNLDDKPIMRLFKRLIDNDSKQNTVLTNMEITDILQKEFNIETTTLQELELEIYLYVIKKFLKDWPQWDEFDQKVNVLKIRNDNAGLKRTLVTKYHSLKNYLEVMLNVTKPLTVKPIKDAEKILGKSIKPDSSDVVLEIHCSRSQLNQLIYREPKSQPKVSFKTVFNTNEISPSMISLDWTTPTLESILNSGDFSVVLNLKGLIMRREAPHELEHVLVNKTISQDVKPKPLKKNMQSKSDHTSKLVNRETLRKLLEDNFNGLEEGKQKNAIENIIDILAADLSYLRESFTAPSQYRRFMSNYSYVRYLYSTSCYSTNKSSKNSYDLQIEETISPRFQIHLVRVDPTALSNLRQENTAEIFIECKTCNCIFNGEDVLENVLQHYVEVHQSANESGPNWLCTKCSNKFAWSSLTHDRWYHDC